MTKTHSYDVASLVTYRPPGQPEQAFTVVRHLPAEHGGPQYRLRASNGQERVAEEALLTGCAEANPGPWAAQPR